jgi:hypothetical protein
MSISTNLKTRLAPVALAAGLLISGTALAVPALEELQQITQPSGETFTAIPKGDEWNNRVETPKGFTVGRGSDGVWR